ncbi:MAG: type IV pilus twitching motility protein PilT [Planctomycetota bacterium]|jgi:twitching motility protein PilT
MDYMDMFKAGVERGASDVILTAYEPPVYRIHGNLWSQEGAARLTPENTKELIYSLLRDDQKARLEESRELDFAFQIRGLARFRGNCFYQRGSLGAAFRWIPPQVPSLVELELPSIFTVLVQSSQGLILVTGPSGSGKSTTLAGMIDEINRRRREHIVTVEDPIEYIHRNRQSVIEQREVGEDTRSFSAALRHVLRQDPDVILIGELRDLDTIATAITAAETGHLVLGTLHTNDCVQSIDRMIDVFPAGQQNQIRSQLAATLLSIVNQRLLPRYDKVGRVVATEVMMVTDAIRSLIRDGKNHQIYTHIATGSQHGMHTMDQDLERLYRGSKIHVDEARRRMRNPGELELRVR